MTNPVLNPFDHNRQKTYQPRDLWEWLLRAAILLFPIDVGIRRIQLDRAEWTRAIEWVRRRVFFWRGTPRPAQADESLNALLARREQVRSRTTAAPAEVNPELFKPVNAPKVEAVSPETAKPASSGPAAAPAEKGAGKDEPTGTTSRLLEAKKRAQRK